EPALRELVRVTAPALVVASGDLTHRGRREQHERAAAFLRGLGPPVLAVPGNHDIPYTFPARFTSTFAEFERRWETARPVFRSDDLAVVGLNSVRAWRPRKRPVARRLHVLATLVDAGAELILAGHIHQAAVSERREFEVSSGRERGVTISIAPGLGQPRPRRRGEARGLHVYEAEADELRVATYVWRDGAFALNAERRLPRGPRPLTPT